MGISNSLYITFPDVTFPHHNTSNVCVKKGKQTARFPIRAELQHIQLSSESYVNTSLDRKESEKRTLTILRIFHGFDRRRNVTRYKNDCNAFRDKMVCMIHISM